MPFRLHKIPASIAVPELNPRGFMALKIIQAAGAAIWIAVALSSPRLMAADIVIKMGGLSTSDACKSGQQPNATAG
jgi:hypothetical protein